MIGKEEACYLLEVDADFKIVATENRDTPVMIRAPERSFKNKKNRVE